MNEKVEAAVQRMKKGKSPGIGGITSEEIKAATAGQNMETLWKLRNKIWEREEISGGREKQLLYQFIKKQILDCNTYRGLSLLHHFSEILTSIMLQRIRKRTDDILTKL